MAIKSPRKRNRVCFFSVSFLKSGICLIGEKEKVMEFLDKGKFIEDNYFYRKHKDGTYEIISIIDKSLIDVFIPDLVTKICDNAFSNCKNLFSVVIPESVKEIGIHAFDSCEKLQYVYLPKSLEEISAYMFNNCKSLFEIHIPAGVKSIGHSAFFNCRALNKIYLSETIINIESDAFEHCGELDYWEYNNALYLGTKDNIYYALIKATKNEIKDCVVHENTCVIASSAFRRCTRLKSVDVAEKVVSVGKYAFYGCTHLEYNQFKNGLYLGSKKNPYHLLVSVDDKSVEQFKLSRRTGVIGSESMKNCENLKEINIHEKVKGIGENAFYGCNNLTIKSNHKEPSEMWSKFWNKLDLFNNLVPVEWEE